MPPYDPYQSGPSSSDQWRRRWKLQLSGAGDNLVITESVDPLPNVPGIAGGDSFRMTFQTTQSRVQTPGSAVISIYNTALGDKITSLIKQYNRLTLSAGYHDGHFGVIFDGTVAYMERGRDQNLVDTYLRIHAIDGDWPLNATTFQKSYAAGTTEGDKGKDAVKAMADNGGRLGETQGLPDTKMPRGHVAFGMATDVMRGIGAKHYSENGKLNVVDPYAPFGNGDNAFVLNSNTGLVGIPTVTPDGVELIALINSDFRLNTLVKVDQSQVNTLASPLGSVGEGTQVIQPNPLSAPGFFADTSADGLYAIISKQFEGDTRGNPWYCHLVLFAANVIKQNPAARGPLGSANITNPPIDIGLGPTPGQIENTEKDSGP